MEPNLVRLVMPLALLFTFAVLFGVVLLRLDGSQLVEAFQKYTVIVSAVILFVVLTVVHLVDPQPWAGEVLKVIAGVLIGGGAASAVTVGSQTAIGSQIRQAGRDLIEQMQGNIGEMRDSVVHQHAAIDEIRDAVASIVERGQRRAALRTREWFKVENDAPEFVSRFRAVLGAGVPQQLIDTCLDDPVIGRQLSERLSDISQRGWEVVGINFDNSGNGLAVNVDLEKRYDRASVVPRPPMEGDAKGRRGPSTRR